MKVFVLTPFLIISWWPYHGDHTLMITSWLSDHDDHEVVMILMIIRSSFWCHFGVLLGGFWSHFGATLSSKIVLEALWQLCSCSKSIFRVQAHPFWKVFRACWAQGNKNQGRVTKIQLWFLLPCHSRVRRRRFWSILEANLKHFGMFYSIWMSQVVLTFFPWNWWTFAVPWKIKNKRFAGKGLQKLKFQYNSCQRRLWIDLR